MKEQIIDTHGDGSLKLAKFQRDEEGYLLGQSFFDMKKQKAVPEYISDVFDFKALIKTDAGFGGLSDGVNILRYNILKRKYVLTEIEKEATAPSRPDKKRTVKK